MSGFRPSGFRPASKLRPVGRFSPPPEPARWEWRDVGCGCLFEAVLWLPIIFFDNPYVRWPAVALAAALLVLLVYVAVKKR